MTTTISVPARIGTHADAAAGDYWEAGLGAPFPIRPRSKAPSTKLGAKFSEIIAKSDRHPSQASRKPGDTVPGLKPAPYRWAQDSNIGIVLAPGVLIIDVDTKGGAPGMETLKEWEAIAGPIPDDVPCVRTPSGGLHYWVLWDGPHPEDAKGVDFLSREVKMAVVPPSKVTYGPGELSEDQVSPVTRAYTWEQRGPLRTLPEAWVDLLTERAKKPVRKPVTKSKASRPKGVETRAERDAWDASQEEAFRRGEAVERKRSMFYRPARPAPSLDALAGLITGAAEAGKSRHTELVHAAAWAAEFGELDAETRATLHRAAREAGLGDSDAEIDRHIDNGQDRGLNNCTEVVELRPARTEDDDEPAEAERVGLPERAPAIFHGPLARAVELLSPHTEADRVGLFAALLAQVAVFGGTFDPDTRARIDVGGQSHPPLVWPLLIGSSGKGRKGTAVGLVDELVREAVGHEFLKVRSGGLSSGEGLVERLKDPEEDEDEQEEGRKGPGILTDEGVISIEDVPVDDKRLLVVEDEFGSVLHKGSREGSTLLPTLKTAWGGGSLHNLKSQSATVSWSHLGVLGQITPGELVKHITSGKVPSDLWNRFLFVYVQKEHTVQRRDRLRADTRAEVVSIIRNAVLSVREAGLLDLDADAEAMFDTLRSAGYLADLDDDERPEANLAGRRADPYTLRIGALLAAVEGDTEVRVEHIEAGLALVRYGVDTARYVAHSRDADPKLEKVLRALDNAGKTGMTLTEMQKVCGLHKGRPGDSDRWDKIRAGLDELGCEHFTKPTKGRPAQAYRRPIQKEEKTA